MSKNGKKQLVDPDRELAPYPGEDDDLALPAALLSFNYDYPFLKKRSKGLFFQARKKASCS